MKFIFILILILGAACSNKKSLENQTQKGHEELYSEVEAPEDEPKGYKRIVIAATNDLSARFAPHRVPFSDDHEKKLQSIEIGGAATIASYFKILRDGYKNVVLVDSGNIFSGDQKDLPFIKDFYKRLKYDAVTVGLNDFNLKIPSSEKSSAEFFRSFAGGSEVPLILSNLYELKTAMVVEWKGTKPYLLKEVNGVKVGIIGLIPDDIVAQTPVENRVGLFVDNMLQSTLRHSRLLRSLGAQIIVVMTHQGIDCGDELAEDLKLPLSKVNFEPTKKNVCDLKNVLGKYLERLPPHLVDVVIGGRNKRKMANYVNETLVLGSFGEGKSFSYVEFFIDTKTKTVAKDRTVVHQPVQFCAEFFKETKDCYFEDPSVDHRPRIPATFLGQEVKKDKALERTFAPYLKEEALKASTLPKIEEILDRMGVDLVYHSGGSGHSQLVVFNVPGTRLVQLLDEDFNKNHKLRWYPNPYFVQGEKLYLMIRQKDLDPTKSYKVVSDLESLTKNSLFRPDVVGAFKTLAHKSWSNWNIDEDFISTRLSGLGPESPVESSDSLRASP